VLTDNGSCFTAAFAKVCAELGAEYRHTKPYSPQTNGMVERFNGRIGSEVLGITVYSHAQLEQLLRGFNAVYNGRRQRVLDGKTPNQVVAERLKKRRKLANPKPQGRAGPDDITRARLVAEAAKEVSRPDTDGGVATWTEPGGVPEMIRRASLAEDLEGCLSSDEAAPKRPRTRPGSSHSGHVYQDGLGQPL
jgi:hypothetical protein